MVLLILLVQKELIALDEGPRAGVLVRALNIAIAPLLMAFAVNMVVRTRRCWDSVFARLEILFHGRKAVRLGARLFSCPD